ncbi:MAG: U32 family peptidase [Candidatus Nitrohelix vancouverensis]|uniref:U32 family peptidase n=1 Tax=Candidatus Nitrohelix vancouverensis TaxID=2705534 RepID=A0A7T0C1M3_9BACT|nr:MAG: U32 family peptidase [Candidatus Nitrohelix vancouverensis]
MNDTSELTPELLAPAGSPDKLKYALAYGADAVYAGIPKFSLRARENGFNDASLKEAISEVHKAGKKIFITANILAPNRKVESFEKSLAYFAEAKPDAFIMSDPGMIQYSVRNFPDVPVHLSVQANAINWPTVAFWRDQGVRRIILSRELSLEEISLIHQKVPDIELESFVHGSICIAYSGRCLLSNYFNHRDANQGTCTNSCRWEYNVYKENEIDAVAPPPQTPMEGLHYIEETGRPGELMPVDEDEHGTYIMNSKDLRAVEFLTELREAGICSFKIEGRSKSIYYLAMVTGVYRRAIEDLMQGRKFDPSLLQEIDKTANRGFTSAFLISNSNHHTERFDSAQADGQPQVFAGRILNSRGGGWIEAEIKNRIETGDTVEYIAPDRRVRFVIEAMENKNGESINVAHGGAGSAWIKTNGIEAAPYSLLSLVMQPAESATSV